jgi:hypothetical protein
MLTQLARTSSGLLVARTLACLANTPASRRELLVSDTSALLEALAVVSKANTEAQLNVVRAVTDLTQEDYGKALVVQSGWLEALVGLSSSPRKAVRLQVALALLNLVQEEEIATKIMQEFGFPLFTSLADINDLEVQRVVERCLEKLNTVESAGDERALREYCVLPDEDDK